MRENIIKFLIVAVIVLISIFFDQWSKQWAEESLSSPRYPDHSVELTVPADAQTMTLEQFIQNTYPNQPEVNQKQMISSSSKEGTHLLPTDKLNGGDKIEVNWLSITVIEGYFDYQYARNPGAAFSFLADQSPDFRKHFFGATGLLAIILILVFIGFSSWKKQKPLIIFLACILGGAVGNIIDRFRWSYVIDFISWHIGEHYWPTFNIADIFVTCGVALLVLDLIIHREKTDQKEDKDEPKKEMDTDKMNEPKKEIEADKKVEDVKDDNNEDKAELKKEIEADNKVEEIKDDNDEDKDEDIKDDDEIRKE